MFWVKPFLKGLFWVKPFLTMEKQIFKNLKKYYLHFNEDKYNKLLLCKGDENIYHAFQKLWEGKHGGLYKIDEPFLTHQKFYPIIKMVRS